MVDRTAPLRDGVFAGLAAAHVVAAALPGRAARLVDRITKPALMPMLACSIRPAGASHRFALAASTVGDIAMMVDRPGGLAGGMLGFGAAHLAYLRLLLEQGRGAGAGPTVACTAGAATVVGVGAAVMMPRVAGSAPRLVAPVLAYLALVSAMGAAAARSGVAVGGPRGAALIAGGLLFVASDALVGLWSFDPSRRFRGQESLIMASYLAAQYGLGRGIAGFR